LFTGDNCHIANGGSSSQRRRSWPTGLVLSPAATFLVANGDKYLKPRVEPCETLGTDTKREPSLKATNMLHESW